MKTTVFSKPSSAFRFPIALLGVCAGLLFAGIGAAHGAWPGKEGPVVYVGYSYAGEESGPEGLRRVRLGRFEDPVALTTDPSDGSPQVSADGRWVVFTRSSPSAENGLTQRKIYVIDIDGGSLRQVSDPPPNADDATPTFDASGTRIFFVRRQGSGQHIYEMPVEGGPARQLTGVETSTTGIRRSRRAGGRSSSNGRASSIRARTKKARRGSIRCGRTARIWSI